MFDLNQSITQWQQALAEDGTLCSEQIAELTAHLADQIDQLRKSPLDEQEAFVIATRRVGKPCEIAEEYDKANPLARWRSRLLWMVGGYLGCTLIGAAVIRPATMLTTSLYQGAGLTEDQTIALTCLTTSALLTLVLSALIPLARRLGTKGVKPPIKPIGFGWVFIGLCILISVTPIAVGAVNMLLYKSFDINSYGLGAKAATLLVPLLVPLLILIPAMAIMQKPKQRA